MLKRFLFICSIIFTLLISSCYEVEIYTVSFDAMLGESSFKIEVIEGELVPYQVPNYNDGYKFVGWTKDLETKELFDFNTIINEDMILYAVWEVDEEVMVKDYSYFIDDYVPDVLTTSLELPRRYDDLNLIWSTSNNKTLTNKGILIQPRTDEKLTVYLTVYDNGMLYDYEKEVLVKAIEFKPLPENNLVFGYYSSWNFFGYPEELKTTCDVINLCFGYVRSDYTIDVSQIIAVLEQVLAVRNHGVRVVLSIQGYGSDGVNFSRAASTDEGRKKLAQSMLNVIETYHLDGIDIDWEYPGYNTGTSVSVDKANYTLLCKQINETLKKANSDYLVTAAIPGGGNGPYRFDLGNVSKYLDYIHIMTYDLQNGSKATHHSALYDSSATMSGCSVASSVNTYLANGVPASKIVIGLAFYGKRTSASSLGGTARGGYKALVYDVIVKDYLSRLNKDVEYGFDEIAQAPYLIDKTNGYFITYEDERSITAKCEYAIKNNIGGVMIWELGEDTSCSLIKEVYNNLKNK